MPAAYPPEFRRRALDLGAQGARISRKWIKAFCNPGRRHTALGSLSPVE